MKKKTKAKAKAFKKWAETIPTPDSSILATRDEEAQVEINKIVQKFAKDLAAIILGNGKK